MRVLFITQVFVPDMYANALLSGALCRHLLRQGHEVSVLTGPSSDLVDPESELVRDVQAAAVYRPVGLHSKRRGFGRRAVSFAQLYGAVLRHATWRRNYDVVIVLTLPPMIYVPALLFRVFSRTRVVLWCMDCYPEIAVETGVIRRRGVIHAVLDVVNRWCLPTLDAAIALDSDMARHLAQQGVRQIEVIPNWESEKDYVPVTKQDRGDFRQGLGVGPDDVMLLYLGNMGLVHEFQTILEALREAAPRVPTLKVVFIGGGRRRHEVEAYRERHGLAQIILKDFIPKTKTRLALGACDVGLITLRPEMVGLVTPSKMYGYLAMSVPLLFVGPPASEVGRIVAHARCGSVVRPGDVSELRDCLLNLPARRSELRHEGMRGADYFQKSCEASVVLPRFERLLDRLRPCRADE